MPVDLHDQHVRFSKPDPVLQAGETSASDIWMSGADANSSVMMQVNNVGAFVRALLPVKLTAGHTITYGVWVGINPAELRHVFDTWWSPGYPNLVITGFIANTVKPWGLLGSPVQLRVLNPEHTPYCVESMDERLRGVIKDQWDHELVLSAVP
jgi:hypothetical protein